MRKDIFIDNNIAKNFSNPMDRQYIRLIAWLMNYNENNSPQNAYLVVSKKLIGEYSRTASAALSSTSIPVLIDKLTREGRLINFKNAEIKEFQQQYFTKTITRKLRSNKADHDHIPIVLMSDRKIALSLDDNLIYDLVHFPGFTVKAEKRPENLPYDK
ncbi:MAG: hypothetical protein KAW12_00640 [Candidatus Aminicenantes bacterium]|nr:hypothetical protein [Candidatus Aminicenantes bacterium]